MRPDNKISHWPVWTTPSGPRLNIKTVFPSMLKISWLQDHLTFNMGIVILARQHLYIETDPRFTIVIYQHWLTARGTWNNTFNFLVSNVLADALASLDVRASAGTVMAKSASTCIHTWMMAHVGLICSVEVGHFPVTLHPCTQLLVNNILLILLSFSTKTICMTSQKLRHIKTTIEYDWLGWSAA